MHALAKFCIQRPVFATMLILSLVVVGIFSYFSLGVDLFPKVDIPTVQVTIADPGASPEEIETEITKKVEDAVNTISEIDEMRSVSSEGQSLLVVTFGLSKNGDVAAQEVQNKVNLIVNDLPQTAKQPVVLKFDPDAANTVSRWETGTYKPTAEDLDKLARLFLVPITVFFRELQGQDARAAALTSAIGGLSKKDFDEVLRYAEFRKARRALDAVKRTRRKP